MKTILKFDQVYKNYTNGVHALRGVSFEVKEGEFISVIGPSGSGKSTLLRAINQLITISGGTVWFDGQTVSGQRGKTLRQQRRKIGMIFQKLQSCIQLIRAAECASRQTGLYERT